jgi:eukaryotic-like serine/threonine-protein kinase
MRPERWQEIDRIFAAALEREPADRAAFLEEACAADEQLRSEVESLIAHDVPESLAGDKAIEEATRLLAKVERAFVGDRIGPYQIIRSLGVGGMGQVYLAQDERLNRPVAVKLLSKYHANDEETIRRFRQEAFAASALNHPNILTVYEIGSFDGKDFIATEFVDGVTLRRRIAAGDLALTSAVDIAMQIASALSAAHQAGIVHRDIKPDNVMVRKDDLVKVLDFGVAKNIQTYRQEQSPHSLLQTSPGAVIGTAPYMSPEQARGLPADPRSDIWSLGVILYEMATGRRPFTGDTALDVMSAVIEREPARLSGGDSNIPAALELIVLKALQKEKELRHQTAAELLADLKQLRQQLDAIADHERSDTQPRPGIGQVDSFKAAVSARGETGWTQRIPGSTAGSAEYITETIKQHRGVFLILAALTIVVAVVGYLYFANANGNAIRSIAVMPFANDSGNKDVEYLSDGMTESLINSLSQLPHLSVKARSSVFRYKDREVEPQQVASELSVQAILNGRVVQRGDNLTVYLSLVDGRNGNQIWGDQYERKITELVTLQNTIARDVSQKLQARLSGADQQKLAKTFTANPEAYKLYLQGRYHILKLTLAEVQTSISYFQQAIAIDPSYALAYVGLADAYRSSLVGDMAPTEVLTKAKSAAQKAVELDDNLADAHAELGFVIFWLDWDWKAAEAQYKRALQLDPNNADAHLFYAHLLSNTGQHAEALAEVKRARELDPLNLRINALEGQFLIHAGRADEALGRLKKVFEMDPSYYFAHLFAASAYIEKGMFPEAITEAHKAREFSGPTNSHPVAFLGYALAKSGKQKEARALAEELVKSSTERYVSAYNIAMIYNALDERDKVFEWLERAYNNRDQKIVFLKVEPKWNNLRSDSRFQDLMRRLGFTT